MFGLHPLSTKSRSVITFAFGLALGLVAARGPSWTHDGGARIERVAGNDEQTASGLLAPPPPLVPDLPAAAPAASPRKKAAAKGSERPSARDIADGALGFTAFVRRGALYGAGVLLDSSGHVLTCRHVIEGTDRVTVSFHDSGPFTADVVDSDKKLDIALLHIDSQRGTPASVAPIASVGTGDDVFGMGAPHKLRFSMSRGLVSYVGRPFDDLYYLQTDLPTNSGNSGGPVMNERGDVVGITTFIFRDSQGLAFALPIDYAFERFKHLLGSQPLRGAHFSAWQASAKAHAQSGG